MIRRIVIATASVALLGALAWPAFAPGELDSLPLSNYPMFAHERDAVSAFTVAVNVDPDGEEHRLDLHEIGRTDQPMQAVMTVRQAVRDGTADDLCDEIAARVDRDGTVEIVTMRLDAVGWFAGHREPPDRTVHASCPTERRR